MSHPEKPQTRGVHHLGLSVPGLPETQRFFTDALGYEIVGELPDYPAVFLSDGSVMLTLWQLADPDGAVPFDRTRVVGLHHLALAVPDAVALDALHERLSVYDGVAIEFAPEALGDSPTRHMMVTIPGGVRVEFIAPVRS
ncbi:MAG: VOC family protein [Planctomycetota bacterium]|jgi:catechol 2,3-dioxygenase-like lactoylglutathione lyase family enzyme